MVTLFQRKHVVDGAVHNLGEWYRSIVAKPRSLNSFHAWPQEFEIEMKNIPGVQDADSCSVKFCWADHQRVVYCSRDYFFKFSGKTMLNDDNETELSSIAKYNYNDLEFISKDECRWLIPQVSLRWTAKSAPPCQIS